MPRRPSIQRLPKQWRHSSWSTLETRAVSTRLPNRCGGARRNRRSWDADAPELGQACASKSAVPLISIGPPPLLPCATARSAARLSRRRGSKWHPLSEQSQTRSCAPNPPLPPCPSLPLPNSPPPSAHNRHPLRFAQISSDPLRFLRFTSCGTESDHHAIAGPCAAARARGVALPHVVTTEIEHPAVIEYLARSCVCHPS